MKPSALKPSAGAAPMLLPDHPAQPMAAVSPDERLALALARLQASRAKLRAAMLPPPQEQPASSGFGLPRRWRAMWRAWTRSGPMAVAAGTAVDAVQSWWRRQPWHASTEWAGRALLAETTPLIRRHPVWAMVLGAGLGAAVVAARPWRWTAVSRRVRPLGGHLVSWALSQLSQVPVQMALAALLAQFVGERARAQAAAPGATPADATTPDQTRQSDPGPGQPGQPGQPSPLSAAASVH